LNRAICVSLDKDVFDFIHTLVDISVLGYFDKNNMGTVYNLSYLGNDEAWQEFVSQEPDLKVIMLVDPPKLKRQLVEYYGASRLISLVAPDTYISSRASLEKGVTVQRGVKILPDAKIGKAVKINVNATIHHDTTIEDYCTIAPGCTLLGNVKIGEGTFVGAGAIILPHVQIGTNVTVGAGAVVLKDVPDNSVMGGVPARNLKRWKELKE